MINIPNKHKINLKFLKLSKSPRICDTVTKVNRKKVLKNNMVNMVKR